MTGELQLELYAAVQDLLLDRMVWFLRHVELARGLADVVRHYRDGIAAVAGALDGASAPEMASARAQRRRDLVAAGVPETLARSIADLAPLAAAPDIVWVADRTNKAVGDVAATYFAVGSFFRVDQIVAAAKALPLTDYFDRLALDRACDSLGDAERRLTAHMVTGDTAPGREAVAGWVALRPAEVDRIRLAINEIATSGLTLSKLAVAASLLGEMVKY
jgi:glutamate dehydrogenase